MSKGWSMMDDNTEIVGWLHENQMTCIKCTPKNIQGIPMLALENPNPDWDVVQCDICGKDI